MARCLLSLIIVALLWGAAAAEEAAPSVAAAHDWPQWRGPNRDNLSPDKGLLDAWPKSGPNLVWTASGLGAGFASVAVSGDRVFTMGDRANGQYVIALSATNGREIWSTRVADIWDPGGYAGPRCTPSVDGETLYVLCPQGELISLQVAGGKVNWRRNLEREFDGQVQGRWGYSESPLVDGDRLICTPGGPRAGIVALDKRSGKEIWRTAIPAVGKLGSDGAAYSSVVISQGAGVRQYVQLVGRGVIGVSASDGRYLWGYNRVANPTAAIPTPLVHDDYIFASSGYQTGAALLKLRKTSSGVQADEVYFLDGKAFQNHHGGMVMLGDYIYAGHGHKAGAPTCIEWRTGKIVWRNNRGPGSGSAAVTYADGNLYFRFEDGLMALISGSPQRYQLKSSFQIPDVEQPSWPQPVIIGGRMYLREQDALLCYDVAKK